MVCRIIIIAIVLTMVMCLSRIQESYGLRVVAVRAVPEGGSAKSALASEGEELEITCSDVLSPCSFIHPNGSELPSSDPSSKHCYVRLKFLKSDSGNWTCRGRVDVVRTQIVRVVDALAAVGTSITAAAGSEVTLSCMAAGAGAPLRSCRFVSPEGAIFEGTSENKSLDGYSYSPGGLQQGNCALTIRRAGPRDRGAWRCTAALQGRLGDYGDVIRLHVEDPLTLSLASTAAISFAGTLLAAAAAVAGGAAWRRRRRSRPRRPARARERCESEPAAAARAVPLIVVHMTRSSSAGLIDDLCLK